MKHYIIRKYLEGQETPIETPWNVEEGESWEEYVLGEGSDLDNFLGVKRIVVIELKEEVVKDVIVS